MKLLKKGAEAEIYITKWFGERAVSKIRAPKSYRYKDLDQNIRERRTFHEAHIMHSVKKIGINTPFLYFLDKEKCEIIMEFIEGINVKNNLTEDICYKIGRYAALLHNNNIIHGDLTTSNFIINSNLVMIDFGLSFFSERIEDKATDIRLMKEILFSAHSDVFNKMYPSFLYGYKKNSNAKTKKILDNVTEIEKRGRYARMT
ncbi:MAG: KEOPS complex kinase/ATPase Bud32 [Nitrososphaeraceae archaeon]